MKLYNIFSSIITLLVIMYCVIVSCEKNEDSITAPESEILEVIDTLFTNWHDLLNYGESGYTGTENDTLILNLWENYVWYIPRRWNEEYHKIRVIDIFRELRVSYTATTDSISTRISFCFKYISIFRFIHNIEVDLNKSERVEFVCKDFQIVSDILGFQVNRLSGGSEEFSKLRLSDLLIIGVRI